MFFFALPLGVDYRARRHPVVTLTLIGINVLVYLITLALSFKGGKETQEWLHQNLWLIPASSSWHTCLTSFFMHDAFSQLAGNMIYLFLFGACVEDILGRTKFMLFFLAGGLIGDVAHIAALPGHFASTIALGGALGAITACMGGFVLLLPRARVEFKWVSMAVTSLRVSTGSFFVPAWLIISFWFVVDMVMVILTQMGRIEDDGMAFAAHVGGFLWGLGTISVVKLGRKQPDQPEETRNAPMRVSVAAQALKELPSIYLLSNDAQSGPFTATQINDMLALGSVPADALYWQEGMTEWRSVTDLQNPAAG